MSKMGPRRWAKKNSMVSIAVDQAGQVLGIVDLHLLHRVHRSGYGGDRSELFDASRVQLNHLGEDPVPQKDPCSGGAAVFRLASQQLEGQHEKGSGQCGQDGAPGVLKGHVGGVDVSDEIGDLAGEGRGREKGQETEACYGKHPSPESFCEPYEGFVDKKH
ncbi:MAG: hypothetical protein IIU32_02310 [Firmicutes bacterium]|nr:hypothetical protein [Bacillota bacterium]